MHQLIVEVGFKQINVVTGVDSDSDHHYETLYTNQNGADDYDTDFESDTESENSFGRVNLVSINSLLYHMFNYPFNLKGLIY